MKKCKLFRKEQLWLQILFGLYALLLVWLVLFKLDFVIPHRDRGVNLIPFYYQDAPNWQMPFGEILFNVLAFLPLGIYLKMPGASAKQIIPIGATASLLFELTQWIFAMGITDVTDLVTNTLGTACGVGLYWLLDRISKKPERLRKGLTITATVGTSLAAAYFFALLFSYVLMM